MCTSAQTRPLRLVTPPTTAGPELGVVNVGGLRPLVIGGSGARRVGVKMTNKHEIEPPGIPTGSKALDGILAGGYAAGRVHLLEGRPGSGKTTLALQFLMAARDRGETGLYVTLSEGRDELIQSAETHGWSLDGIDIYELVPPELSLDPSQQQSV